MEELATSCVLAFIKISQCERVTLLSVDSLKERMIKVLCLPFLLRAPELQWPDFGENVPDWLWNDGVLKNFHSSRFQKAFSTACNKSIETVRLNIHQDTKRPTSSSKNTGEKRYFIHYKRRISKKPGRSYIMKCKSWFCNHYQSMAARIMSCRDAIF